MAQNRKILNCCNVIDSDVRVLKNVLKRFESGFRLFFLFAVELLISFQIHFIFIREKEINLCSSITKRDMARRNVKEN